LRELLAELAQQIGVPASFERRPARAGDIRHSRANIGAARRLLGYKPTVDFATGLARTVAWYREGR